MRRLLLIVGALILCATSVTWLERRAGVSETVTPAVMAVAGDSGAPAVIAPQPVVVAQALPTATSTPAPYFTPTTDAALMAQITLVFAQATDTQVAIAKTETAIYAATNTRQAELAQLQAQQTVQAAQTFTGLTAQATVTQAAQTQQAFITQTHQAATAEIFAAQVESTKVRAWAGTFFLVVCGMIVLAWLGAKAWGAWKQEQAKYLQASQIDHDAQGRLPAVPSDALGKNGKLVNPNYAHRAVLDPNQDDLSTEQALANTASLRALEATRAVAQSPAFVRQAVKKLSAPEQDGQMPYAGVHISKPDVPLLDRSQTFPMPDWTLLNNWDGKKLPYGNNQSGLLLADPVEEPHWLIVGRTRSGKSRYGTRTIAAAALTMGYQVLFVGKRVDFYPFEGHPNARIVGVDLYNEPKKYFQVLQQVARLMKQRDDYLTERRMSIWQQTGLPQIYIVLDEFSSAIKQLNAMKAGAGNVVSSMATALIQEGGKYGLNIIQVVQDATGANVDITARRNMGKMVFRLSEQRASDVALGVNGEPSAVGLPARHFLSVIGETAGVIRGVAFAPSDEQVAAFLQSRPVPAHAPMDWIDGIVVDDEPKSKTSAPAIQPEEATATGEVVQMAESIRSRWTPGMSKSSVSRLFGKEYTGTVWCNRVTAVIDYLVSTSTSTPPQNGGFEPIGA